MKLQELKDMWWILVANNRKKPGEEVGKSEMERQK